MSTQPIDRCSCSATDPSWAIHFSSWVNASSSSCGGSPTITPMVVEQHVPLPVDVRAAAPEVCAIHIGHGHADTVVPVVVGRMVGRHHHAGSGAYRVQVRPRTEVGMVPRPSR